MQFGALLKDDVAALSFKNPDDVMQDVGEFVLSTGVAPTQLKGTAQICLAVGYRTDDPDVTLGSALVLIGPRRTALCRGHRPSSGAGLRHQSRTDLALAWYEVRLDALKSGATPVFAATLPERTRLDGGLGERAAARNGIAPVEAVAPTRKRTTLPAFASRIRHLPAPAGSATRAARRFRKAKNPLRIAEALRLNPAHCLARAVVAELVDAQR